jgi:hypothetical protein
MRRDKAIGDKAKQERGVKICDDFWHQFLGLSLAFVKFFPDATIYDIFNFMREQNGGTSYSQSFLDMIDAEVETEYQKDLKRGYPSRY